MKKEAIKILEENTHRNLSDLGYSKFSLDTSPEARERGKNELLGLHQVKKLPHSKGNDQQS